jgi:Cys-tRNA(Pro) deacylase
MGKIEFLKIKKLLDENRIKYDILEHELVYTSEQAAKVRNSQLKQGVKALVLRSHEGKFILALIAADKKIDLKQLSKIIKTKELKLAKPDEVSEKTDCEIGSVPPFGNVLNLVTYMDKSVLENEIVEFNVGLHTTSIRMKSDDLIKITKPFIAEFALKT